MAPSTGSEPLAQKDNSRPSSQLLASLFRRAFYVFFESRPTAVVVGGLEDPVKASFKLKAETGRMSHRTELRMTLSNSSLSLVDSSGAHLNLGRFRLRPGHREQNQIVHQKWHLVDWSLFIHETPRCISTHLLGEIHSRNALSSINQSNRLSQHIIPSASLLVIRSSDSRAVCSEDAQAPSALLS